MIATLIEIGCKGFADTLSAPGYLLPAPSCDDQVAGGRWQVAHIELELQYEEEKHNVAESVFERLVRCGAYWRGCGECGF